MLLAAAPSASAQGVDTTCPFSLTRFDTTTNVLALDTSAVYWTGTYVPIPGTRIRIQGQFPHARYTNFSTYNTIGRPIDSIADVQIKPDAGGRLLPRGQVLRRQAGVRGARLPVAEGCSA